MWFIAFIYFSLLGCFLTTLPLISYWVIVLLTWAHCFQSLHSTFHTVKSCHRAVSIPVQNLSMILHCFLGKFQTPWPGIELFWLQLTVPILSLVILWHMPWISNISFLSLNTVWAFMPLWPAPTLPCRTSELYLSFNSELKFQFLYKVFPGPRIWKWTHL